jgi:hypothetical protein
MLTHNIRDDDIRTQLKVRKLYTTVGGHKHERYAHVGPIKKKELRNQN